jgi:hypothetical protein
MPTMVITLRFIVGSAAAGIAKLHRGLAGFTGAGGTRAVPVLLSTCADMSDSTALLIEYIFLIIVGCVGDWFLHDSTCIFVDIITHMRINHLKDRFIP